MLTILQRLCWNRFFPKIFHHFGPLTSSWPPKQYFLIILSNFSQISAFFLSITWRVPHKTIVEIVHDTLEILRNIFFPKFLTILALGHRYDVIFSPKQHFWGFWGSRWRHKDRAVQILGNKLFQNNFLSIMNNHYHGFIW